MDNWSVFICYRQVDGLTAAARTYELLNEQVVPLTGETGHEDGSARLDVYFDQTAPGVEDWTAVHEPFLKRARAMIVICTPGAKLYDGPKDWVHREIGWWLENRQMAPILVDPLGASRPYVPDAIAKRWPNAQRIKLIETEWDDLSGDEHRALDEQVRGRFLGAIAPSGDGFYRQELELEERRAARLKRTIRAAVGLGVAFLAVAAMATVALKARNEAVEARKETEVALRQTEAARALVQTRVIENQAARGRTEARLLEILQGLDQYENYVPTLEQWETELRSRADSLAQSVREDLPECSKVAGFTVYEKQLVAVHLDEPEPETLFAYLALVPGQSARAGDWDPAVLDVFFANEEDVRTGRDLGRGAVKRVASESAAPESQWALLMGLGTPHLLTQNGRNYRLSRTGLRMNDEGDMIMAFDICREAGMALD